jgi:hypothetical protein
MAGGCENPQKQVVSAVLHFWTSGYACCEQFLNGERYVSCHFCNFDAMRSCNYTYLTQWCVSLNIQKNSAWERKRNILTFKVFAYYRNWRLWILLVGYVFIFLVTLRKRMIFFQIVYLLVFIIEGQCVTREADAGIRLNFAVHGDYIEVDFLRLPVNSYSYMDFVLYKLMFQDIPCKSET